MEPWMMVLIPAAVGLIVGLQVLLGWRGAQRLPDDRAILHAVRQSHPDFRPGRLAVDVDRRGALLAEADGPRTLVIRALGADLAPVLVPDVGDIGVALPEADLISIDLRDLTQPRLRLRLASADDANWFARRLRG